MKPYAALAVLAVASAGASAQSNVTLFGIVDANVRSVKNGDSDLKSLSTGGLSSSRLGVRGVEDLGGGLRALFWLEHGFNPDTGSQSDAARFWNRRATVAINGSFGELRLGRDFTPTYLGFSDYDAFGSNGLGATDKFINALGTNADTLTRSDNLLSYYLPPMGGLFAQFSLAPGENVAGKKYYGGRIGYIAGPLNVSASLGQTKVTASSAGVDTFKISEIGASYDFKVVKLTGFYSQTKFGDLERVTINVGALVPLGSGTLRLSYIDADASGLTAARVSTEANDGKQLAIGYVYDLSKRTSLYTTYARIDNKGSATFAVATPPAVPAGRDSSGYEFGIRHRF